MDVNFFTCFLSNCGFLGEIMAYQEFLHGNVTS